MQVLLLIAFIILAYKPIDNFIKGKVGILEDTYQAVRLLLITFFLVLVFLTGSFLVDYLINNEKGNLDSAFFTSLIIVFYVVILLYLRKQYKNTYSEDLESFHYKGIFINKIVRFDDRPQYYYIKTNTIKPYNLINYIVNNYEIKEDNYKTMYLRRK